MRGSDELSVPASMIDLIGPAYLIYGDLIRKHMHAAVGRNDGLRKRIFEAIELMRELYPEETKRWDDRYTLTEQPR